MQVNRPASLVVSDVEKALDALKKGNNVIVKWSEGFPDALRAAAESWVSEFRSRWIATATGVANWVAHSEFTGHSYIQAGTDGDIAYATVDHRTNSARVSIWTDAGNGEGLAETISVGQVWLKDVMLAAGAPPKAFDVLPAVRL